VKVVPAQTNEVYPFLFWGLSASPLAPFWLWRTCCDASLDFYSLCCSPLVELRT